MRWVMVAPTWLLMSSPTIGTLGRLELRRPLGVAGDEHRDRVDERDAGVEARLRVEALRLLGADREVAHEHVGVRVAQHLRHVDRLGRRLLDRLAVVLAEAVEGRAALHLDLELADVGELDRVVLPGGDRLAQVEADLGGVDVERGDEVDVAHVVAAEHDVHEARARPRWDRRCGSTRRPGRGCSRSSRLRRWRHECDHS